MKKKVSIILSLLMIISVITTFSMNNVCAVSTSVLDKFTKQKVDALITAPENTVELSINSTDGLKQTIKEANNNASSSKVYKLKVSNVNYNGKINLPSYTAMICDASAPSTFSKISLDEYSLLSLYNSKADTPTISSDHVSVIGGICDGDLKVDGSNVSAIGLTLSKGNVIKVTGGKVDRISYNTITNGDGQGIKVYESATVTSVDHNTVNGATQRGILVDGVCKEVSYNKISDVKWDGIGVYHGGNGGDIHHNTLKNIGGLHNGVKELNIGDYGIQIDATCDKVTSCKSIHHNTISHVTYSGISVFSGEKYKKKSKVTGSIYNNTISYVGTFNSKYAQNGCGIYLDTYAVVNGSIHHNTVKKARKNSIYMYNHSYLGGSIHHNTVDSLSQKDFDGIKILDCTIKGSIYSNTVKNIPRFGIVVQGESQVQKIYNNTVTKCGSYGLGVLQNTIKVTIDNNKLSGNKSNSIYTPGKLVKPTIRLSSVKNMKSKKAVLKFKKASSHSKVFIYQGTSKKKLSKKGSTKGNSYTVKKLKKGKKYYYYVKGYTKNKYIKIYTRKSAIKSVKIKK